MLNLYEIIKENLFFNKFVLNDLVCVEYTCPLDEEQLGIFTQSDYIIHVLSGEKAWRTIHGEWSLVAGDTLYVKKGAAIITQNFEEDFCMLGFFLPDSLIRECLADRIQEKPVLTGDQVDQFTAIELKHSTYLDGFFQSMLIYFRGKEQPPDSIIKLKINELLINIVNDSRNKVLISYFKSLTDLIKPSIQNIMESNFCYNLNMKMYAKLCHRSLSTFKRDFRLHFNTTPGKWLLSKRLHYAAKLLLQKHLNVTQIAFKSGFENVSHFNRVFKRQFHTTPTAYRKVNS